MILESMWLKSKLNSFGFILLCCLNIIPLASGFIYSLAYSFGLVGIGNGFTLVHWEKILFDFHIYFSFAYSFYIAIVALAIIVFTSLFFAINFKKKLSKGYFSYLLHIPLAIPAIVAGFLSFQLFSKSGWISRFFLSLGVINNSSQFPDIVNDDFGISIIITHVFIAIPFFTIYFLKLYQSENLELFSNASFTLGANHFQTNQKIIIPILLKAAFPVILLYLLFLFGSYEIPLLLGSQSYEMVSVLAERKLQRFDLNDIPGGYVIAIIYFLVTSIFVYQSNRIKNNFNHV